MTPPMGGMQEPPSPPSGGGMPSEADIRPMLIKVLQKAKTMAEGAGLNFDELVAEVSGGGESLAPTAPRPPSSLPQM